MNAWRPATLREALELRAEHPDASVVAGGTDLMVAGPAQGGLIDLTRIDELQAWERDDDLVSVGAAVTFARIAHELDDQAALVEAARSVGSPQVRNRATIGGNLATASPAGDGIAVLAAYDAEIVLASAGRGRRTVRWSDFLAGPKRTTLAADELVVAVRWRPPDGPGVFAKLGPRRAMVIAVASVCVQLDDGLPRIALGSVAPTVIRAFDAEAHVAVHHDHEQAAAIAAAECSPIDDLRGSAEYRRHAVGVLVRRLLDRTLPTAGKEAA